MCATRCSARPNSTCRGPDINPLAARRMDFFSLAPPCAGLSGEAGGESIRRRRMPRKTAVFRLLSGLRDTERGRGMRFTPSIFGKLLEPIKRRQFDALVARHAGDAYVKSFASWNHLLALVYAQFSSATSLRGLEAG